MTPSPNTLTRRPGTSTGSGIALLAALWAVITALTGPVPADLDHAVLTLISVAGPLLAGWLGDRTPPPATGIISQGRLTRENTD